jgi:hypothetical protein
MSRVWPTQHTRDVRPQNNHRNGYCERPWHTRATEYDPERVQSCLKQHVGRTGADCRGVRATAREEPVSEGVGRFLVLTGLSGSGNTALATQTGCINAGVSHVP